MRKRNEPVSVRVDLPSGRPGRASVYFYEDSGFRENKFLGRDDTNGREELTARGKLSWDISSGWNALLSGLYADFDNGYDAWSLDNTNITLSDRRTPAVDVGDPELNSPEFTNLGQDTQETKAASLRVSLCSITPALAFRAGQKTPVIAELAGFVHGRLARNSHCHG